MTIPLWLVFLVILGAFVWLIIYAIQINREKELLCVTCGKYHTDKSTLTQCETCKRMICADNIEIIEQASTSSNILIEVTPSETNSTYPCGTFYMDDNSIHFYCKKDTPRFNFAHSFVFKK